MKHKPRARGEDRRGQIQEMVNLHYRLPEINEYLVPRHWEGDLIKDKGNRAAVGTIVERKTLFTVLAKMEKATAEYEVAGFIHVLNGIEGQKRLSMTYDQGREIASH